MVDSHQKGLWIWQHRHIPLATVDQSSGQLDVIVPALVEYKCRLTSPAWPWRNWCKLPVQMSLGGHTTRDTTHQQRRFLAQVREDRTRACVLTVCRACIYKRRRSSSVYLNRVTSWKSDGSCASFAVFTSTILHPFILYASFTAERQISRSDLGAWNNVEKLCLIDFACPWFWETGWRVQVVCYLLRVLGWWNELPFRMSTRLTLRKEAQSWYLLLTDLNVQQMLRQCSEGKCTLSEKRWRKIDVDGSWWHWQADAAASVFI